jgi:hypothetical protein
MKNADKLYIIDTEYKFDTFSSFNNHSWRGWKGKCGAYSFNIGFAKENDFEKRLSNKQLVVMCDVECTVFNNGEEIGQTTIENKKANQETIVDAIKLIIRNYIINTNQVESWALNSLDYYDQ